MFETHKIRVDSMAGFRKTIDYDTREECEADYRAMCLLIGVEYKWISEPIHTLCYEQDEAD